MQRCVILISGVGSNMQAIINAELRGLQIAAVISSDPQAAGLAFCRERGIATEVFDHRQYPRREVFDQALADAICAYQADWIVLAGFMRILTELFVQRFAGRLLNIHPSLLPAFKGMNTHQQALAAGVRVHGASVHLVTAELDDGPILMQAVVPVLFDDNEATLAARVLAVEHKIYPHVLSSLVSGSLKITDGKALWQRQSGLSQHSHEVFFSPEIRPATDAN